MTDKIKKVAVLGAGVMGSGIAAHLANAGVPCYLIDIVPKELTEEERERGLSLESPQVKNRFSIKGIEYALNSKPPSFFDPSLKKLITPGNYEDNSDWIGEADWIIEVVVENLNIKQKVYEHVEKFRRPDSIVTSNTSGLPIKLLSQKMSQNMKNHFFVTHFFNPVRYMKLLEIVKGEETDPGLVEIIREFAEEKLGKGVVFGKDTPNFIANRIGVHDVMVVMHLLEKYQLGIEIIDEILGPPLGKPKSAVFRTTDIVGIDTLVHVANNIYENCIEDEERELFKVPEFLKKMVEKGLLGQKAGTGFYKVESRDGEKKILVIEPTSLEYREEKKVKFRSLSKAKDIDDVGARIKVMIEGEDEASRFAWEVVRSSLVYAARRIPEIADDIVNVDRAMRWGFNWEIGPFETWDALGVKYVVERLEEEGIEPPELAIRCLRKGEGSFYKWKDQKKLYFDISGSYKEIQQSPKTIYISDLKQKGAVIEENEGATLLDLGDDVVCLEFHTKMNAIDDDVVLMIYKAVERAEREFRGLIITNDHPRAFSAGANIMTIAMKIQQKAWSEIDEMVKGFQRATWILQYSKIPTVAAPFGLTLGGGCEIAMACDAIVAHSELYMGLVEMGVGLIPAGGGCLRLLIRNMDNPLAYGPIPFVQATFQTIAMAKVSMSAVEAQKLNFLREGVDSYIMNRDHLIFEAKRRVLELAKDYKMPEPRNDIYLPGKDGRLVLEYAVENEFKKGTITEYEMYMGKQLAYVLTGGDTTLTQPVSEQKILDLEREVFLNLCQQKKTLERIQHMLMKNKPLRN